jgi:hypothetical protein
MSGPLGGGRLGGDPFDNPFNRIIDWTNKKGQYNQKIVQGPDEGIHRGYDPNRLRSFQTGTDRVNADPKKNG